MKINEIREIIVNGKKKVKITKEQIDTLKELGNIGTGNAITALSHLLNKNVKMSLTSLDIIPFWQVPYLFKDPTNEVVGILSRIEKQNEFKILQIYTKESVIKIINNLNEFKNFNHKNIKGLEDFDEFSLSIVKEIGNILVGHYASALADLLSIKLIPSVPNLALDNINALISCLIAKYSQEKDFTLIIETKLEIDELKLTGFICFISSFDTVNKFLLDLANKYEV